MRFPLGTKGRLDPACLSAVMFRGSETWPGKEGNLISLERNDVRMFRWRCKVMPED